MTENHRRRSPSTYFQRRVTHLTALRAFQARSVVRRDGGPSQGPRDESVRARKAVRRVVFRGRRRASAPLDDVQHLRRDASYPEAAKRQSYVPPSYENKYLAVPCPATVALVNSW